MRKRNHEKRVIEMPSMNQLIDEAVSIIHPSLWEVLIAEGLNIKLSEESSLRYGKGGDYGENTKLIYLFYADIRTLLHEIGHFIFDHLLLGRFFKSDILYSIFAEYVERLMCLTNPWSSYKLTTIDVREYFAEGFAFFFLETTHLLEEDPRLVYLIDRGLMDLLIHFGYICHGDLREEELITA